MQSSFLTPEELAARWNMPPATLSQWRWNGRGPQYFKIGRHVLYKVEDIEQFEEGKRRSNTSIDSARDTKLEPLYLRQARS